MDVNMRRLGSMRIGARFDRAELILAVRSYFHPALQPRMARIVLFIVIASHVRLKNKKDHVLRRRLSIGLKNFAGDDQRLTGSLSDATTVFHDRFSGAMHEPQAAPPLNVGG